MITKKISLSVLLASLVPLIVFAGTRNRPYKDYKMNHAIVTKPAFKVVGISVKTDMQKAALDIGNLWKRFADEKVAERIAHKVDQDISWALLRL